MYEQFIEYTDQIFRERYAEQLAKGRPRQTSTGISRFFDHVSKLIFMKDRIFLLVATDHRSIDYAIAEFQEQTQIQLSDTPHVKLLALEVIKMNTKEKKG